MKKPLSFLVPFGISAAFILAAEPAPKPLDILVQVLAKTPNPAVQANILRGMHAGLQGRHGLIAPGGWDELAGRLRESTNEEVRRLTQELSVTFGSSAALEAVRQTLTNPAASLEDRKAALASLSGAHDAGMVPALLQLLAQPGPLRAPALRALSAFDNPEIAPAILSGFSGSDSAEQRDALTTLLTRAGSARALLAAIDAGKINQRVLTPPLARQLQSLKDPAVDEWTAKHLGIVRTTSQEKQAQIAQMKQFLTPESIVHADAERGRALFSQTCAICHTLFGQGGKIGPELPGSFEDVDYLLQNIVDPNAIIGAGYEQTFVRLKNGASVSGIIGAQDAASLTLKTLAGELPVQRADIAEMKVSDQSMMPEGLLSALDQQSVRDLFAYLRQPRQVPLLATPGNAADFFNGNDLGRWSAAPAGGWEVQKGELIGHGLPDRTTSLASEMVARQFRLTLLLRLTGRDAAAELAFEGRPHDGKFHGHSLSFGGPTAPALWEYGGGIPKPLPLALQESGAPPERVATAPTAEPGWLHCEIISEAGKTRLILDGRPVAEVLADKSGSIIAFHLLGAGAELHVKDLKLEVPQ